MAKKHVTLLNVFIFDRKIVIKTDFQSKKSAIVAVLVRHKTCSTFKINYVINKIRKIIFRHFETSGFNMGYNFVNSVQ